MLPKPEAGPLNGNVAPTLISVAVAPMVLGVLTCCAINAGDSANSTVVVMIVVLSIYVLLSYGVSSADDAFQSVAMIKAGHSRRDHMSNASVPNDIAPMILGCAACNGRHALNAKAAIKAMAAKAKMTSIVRNWPFSTSR